MWSVCSPIAPSACVLLGATESYALEVPCEESIACIYYAKDFCYTTLGGELLQYFGDGSLSIFRSAVEGVTASIEIQRELQSLPKLPVRVGLHLGDIAYDEQGAYGDAVNVAARIEDLSIPGGILISGKIAEEIRNHPELTAVRLGSYELKNVPDAVDIYAILAEGIEVPRPTELTQHGNWPDTARESALPQSLQAHLDRIRQQPVYRVREARVLPRPLPLTGREAEMEVLRSLGRLGQ